MSIVNRLVGLSLKLPPTETHDVRVTVHQLGGWYDIFLPGTLVDYGRLKQGGLQPYLTIGPWWHTDFAGLGRMVRETFIWK
jgi:predicted acyl esterase